ncbi:AAA family ATPase [Flavobacteriaceae bacterium Ap0902]|nr:AAA family ATPase [Flavobacteriaceae bacterium Ap0902]
MNNQRKQKITNALKGYCERKGGQNKAANTLKDVSSALISQVLNNNWDRISDGKWRSIESQIGVEKTDWIGVETANYQILSNVISDAQTNSQVYAVVESAGGGKTYTLKEYERQHSEAYMVQCNEYWNRKAFMGELLTSMGRDYSGLTINDMMSEVVRLLKAAESPVLLLDEFDKVTDQVLYFFITIYNQLEDHCGIVICATDHLEKRIKRGLKLNKKGYNEIYSRIGRKFIELAGVTQQDVIQLCHVNGITEKEQIKEVWKECEGDLRRVKRKVHALKLANKNSD